MSRDRIAEMQTFLRVVDLGSFSAAARETGLSQSYVSKIVAGLERRLGARLLNRTTRHVTPTEAGLIFYDRSKAALGAIDDAEAEARSGQVDLRGTLRISTSAMASAALVLPAILAFREAHPGVQIEAVVEDRRIDPVEERIDLIVRSGALTDSSLVARRAGYAELVIVASPAYLSGPRSIPATAGDLAAHDIVIAGRGTGNVDTRLRRRWENDHVAVVGPGLRVSTAILAREIALAGAAITFIPRFLAEQDLVARSLIEIILPDLNVPGLEINLVHAYGTAPPLRVRTFMDLAVKLWRESGRLTDRS